MITRIVDADALKAISPASLRSYAIFEGWKHVDAYGETSEVYLKQIGDRSVEIILPVTEKIGDYASVVSQVLSVFAREGDLDQLAVYKNLTLADRDVIRCGSAAADADGAIAVEAGVDLVIQARNMLAASACSASEPRPYFYIGKNLRANEYMERVRLGQTERGSFVVTLLAPVPPALESQAQVSLWPELVSEPYERQVTRVFARGLEAASIALTLLNRGEGIGAFDAAVQEGVSANLCEAVAAIAERGNGATVSVTWARTRPAPTEQTRVTFARSDAGALREVARQFRLREPRNDVMLFGATTHLKRGRKQAWGTVTFASILEDGRPRSVTVELQREDYERAVEAHKTRQPISIRGDLVRAGQRWHLRNPRGLAIVVPES